mgnify:CR=1 FL=1
MLRTARTTTLGVLAALAVVVTAGAPSVITVRPGDTLGRWGGDEYVCLLLEVRQKADVALLAEKMIRGIAEAFESGGAVLNVECSIGIAMYPADGEAAYALLKNADAAMYQSKSTDTGVAFSHTQQPTDAPVRR